MTRNACWAHPEQLLLGIVPDRETETRKVAVQRIVRVPNENQDEVRAFALPKIAFGARRITDMIEWDQADIAKHPLMRDASECELLDIEKKPL